MKNMTEKLYLDGLRYDVFQRLLKNYQKNEETRKQNAENSLNMIARLKV